MREIAFFGSTFQKSILFIILAELISFVLFILKDAIDLRLYFFIIIFIFLIILGLVKIKWLVFIAISELIIGSKGYLFSIDINGFDISIRIAIFIAVMFSWLIIINKKELFQTIITTFKQNKFLFWLMIASVFSLLFAIAEHTPLKDIFLDINGWLFFAYLFPWLYAIKTNGDLNQILQILFAGTIAIIGKTLIFLYIFAHQLPLALDLYHWGRNTLWGEFTFIEGGISRIFSQSQIYALVVFLICMALLFLRTKLLFKDKNTRYPVLIIIWLIPVIIASLSRSFWVGIIISIFILIFSIKHLYGHSIKKQLLSVLIFLAIAAIGYGLTNAIINFPFPKTGTFYDSTMFIAKRFSEDEAISSRWSQLPELKKTIFNHPIVGSGWGKSITYYSSDPRIKTESNPTGEYNTYTFEWGYLDMLIKIGLIGLIFYLLLIYSILKKILILSKKDSGSLKSTLLVGLGLGLIMISVVHFFSPYLNHPLGIGYVILLIVIIKIIDTDTTSAESHS